MGIVMNAQRNDTIRVRGMKGVLQIDQVETVYACSPKGGGMVVRVNPADVTEVNPPPEPWRKAIIGFDEGPLFVGFIREDDRWNGWLQPAVKSRDIERIVEVMNECGDGMTRYVFLPEFDRIDWTMDSTDGDSEEERGRIEATVVRNTVVYNLHGLGYCWMEYDNAEYRVDDSDGFNPPRTISLEDLLHEDPMLATEVARLGVGEERRIGGGAGPLFVFLRRR